MLTNNPINHSVLKLSMDFDNAFKDKNIEEIHRLIEFGKNMENTIDDISKIHLFYSIGTAYGDIFELSDNLVFNIDTDCIVQQIYYFRKAIEILNNIDINPENNRFVHPSLCSLYTNYANLLDACGRKQLAIKMYCKCIQINPKFTMASGNLAICLHHYRNFLSDNEHLHFIKKIKSLIETSITVSDPNRVDYAEKRFIELYEQYLNYKDLDECSCKTIDYNPNSQKYREWCWNNGLYLNPLNDLQADDINRYDDNLLLPSLLFQSDKDLNKYISMFNQIKQEYVYARYLCFNSIEIDSVHYADENVYLIDCLDYVQYSIRVEGLKASFKTLYSLLDKVAMFINEYYSLKIKTRQVNFHSIWRSNSDLNKMLDKNIGLSSIFWIEKDFDNGDNSLTANPNSKRLKIIRNYLEHRFTNITLNIFNGSEDNEDNNETRLYLTEFELQEFALDLLNLVREVIFSLKNAIQISENEKQSTISSEVALIPINYEEVDSEDKL